MTTRVDPALAEELSQYDAKFTGVIESHFVANLLSWLFPIIVFFAIWLFVFRKVVEKQGGLGGFMTVGKSKAKVYMETDTKVTFDDIAGVVVRNNYVQDDYDGFCQSDDFLCT